MLNIAGGRLNIYTLHYQQQTESRWNSQATCAASRLNGGENICEWTLRCLLDIARINSHSTRLSSSCYFIYEWTMRYAFVFIVLFMNGHCVVSWTLRVSAHKVRICLWPHWLTRRKTPSYLFHHIILFMNGHCVVFWTLCVSTHIIRVCIHRIYYFIFKNPPMQLAHSIVIEILLIWIDFFLNKKWTTKLNKQTKSF